MGALKNREARVNELSQLLAEQEAKFAAHEQELKQLRRASGELEAQITQSESELRRLHSQMAHALPAENTQRLLQELRGLNRVVEKL